MVTRAGFTLIEVLVSLVLFAVALLGLAAVSAVAATTMGRAHLQERAAARAAAVLDSLAFDPAPGSGLAEHDGLRISWTVDGDGIEVRARTTLDSIPVTLRAVRIPALAERDP